jgi:hypothetical protein
MHQAIVRWLAVIQRLLQASSTNSVCIELLWRQPTMRRLNTSTTNAT